MRHLITCFCIVALSLTLAACGKPDRKSADTKLASACEAAIRTLYAKEDTLDIKDKQFSDDKSHDGLELRRVYFNAEYVQNGGVIEMKEYTCWFEERTGLFGYLPKFFKMDVAGTRYGNFDGTIEGDYGALIKIQDATETVLMGN